MTDITAPFRDSVPDDAARAPAADPLVGMTIAERYRIVGPLGAGGMGVVYKVEHIRMGKLMAMKLLSGELSRDANVVKRFKREAQLASKLSHPNTVQVFDFGQADHLTYLVMELVPGEDLSRLLRSEGPMATTRMARLMVQVCGSLAEAHNAGIVHRDLKPENVMVVKAHDGKNEIAKVCDFGLAKLREQNETANDVTSHGAVVGTPYYMSPEQIRGEDVDARTDVYALGAVIYRLLTGNPPFGGQSPMAVFAKHLTEAPVPPSEKSPYLNIPKAADAIVMRCLAKKREDRYASVEAVQSDLVDLLHAGNASSVDILVNSDQMREMAGRVALVDMPTAVGGVAMKAATRNEVEAYERKLRRERLAGQALIAFVICAVLFGVYRGVQVYTTPKPYQGTETEPNNTAAEANVIPFGEPVRGFVGKRLASGSSDRDFFAVEVPQGQNLVFLRTTALPNMATCTWFYRAGMSEPLARFCSGGATRDLEVGLYRVEPGRYLLAVLQDMAPPNGEGRVPVHENISDEYTLEFLPRTDDDGREVEPNDSVPTSNRVAVGKELKGTLGFVNDTDVLCPAAGTTGPVRWLVQDALDRPRDAGTVLEATVEQGGTKGQHRVLVHRHGVQGSPNATNVLSPYKMPSVTLDGAPGQGCLRLKLASDPWSATPNRDPMPGRESYVVKLEAGP